MTRKSAAREIESRLRGSREALVATVGPLDDAALDRRPAPGGWSPREQVDHVERSERAFLILLRMIRFKEVVLPWTRSRETSPGPLDFSYAGTSIRTPRLVRPRGHPTLPELLARLERTRLRSLDALGRRARIAGRGARWPHPAFGPLDAIQWLAVAALHERHHVEQIRRAVG